MRIGILLAFLVCSSLTFSQCPEKDFIGPNHKFAYLKKLTIQLDTLKGDKLQEIEFEYFCNFPDYWPDVRELTGYNKETATQPISSFRDLLLIWGHFIELGTIDKRIYYQKYVNLHVGGTWTSVDFDPTLFTTRLATDSGFIFDELERKNKSEISSVLQLLLSCSSEEQLESKFSQLITSIGGRTTLKQQLQIERNNLIETKPWND